MQILQEECIFPSGVWLQSSIDQQIALRALSYHAIQTKHFGLLKWLFEAGLDVDEGCYWVSADLTKWTLPSAPAAPIPHLLVSHALKSAHQHRSNSNTPPLFVNIQALYYGGLHHGGSSRWGL
jgi:hypothetical protein